MAQQMKHTKISLKTADDGNENNRQQSDIYAKDSMDRFGDDMCGLILSYLSLEDRFRCECVSKQFQRTVFESVVDIILYSKLIKLIQNTNQTITQTMERMAKKCPNIQTVDCKGICLSLEVHISEVLQPFRDNCLHLRDIYCSLGEHSSQWIPTYGPLVTRVRMVDPDHNLALIHCHRLSLLCVDEFYELFDGISGQLLVKNLKRIYINVSHNNSPNMAQVSAFVATNQCLKYISVYMSDAPIVSSHPIISQLSQLSQLREISLTFTEMDGNQSLYNSLRDIGLNCKQLKRLSLNLCVKTPEFNVHTLDALRFYSYLNRINLKTSRIGRQSMEPLIFSEKVLEPLKLCHRLTHLTLKVWEISRKFFFNCDKHWPRLQYLSIDEKNHNFNFKCLDRISRLPALQTLKIGSWDQFYDLSDNDFWDLLSRSRKL